MTLAPDGEQGLVWASLNTGKDNACASPVVPHTGRGLFARP
jgi:hypothetical protein